MLPWPIAVGMFAHALRWLTLTQLGFGAATGALVACVVVALILTPVSRRTHMPFAAIGFASDDPSASRVMGGSRWMPSAEPATMQRPRDCPATVALRMPAWRRSGRGRTAPLMPFTSVEHLRATLPLNNGVFSHLAHYAAACSKLMSLDPS